MSRGDMVGKSRAQLLPESVVVIAMLMLVLLMVLIANRQLESQSIRLQQQLQASTAATQMAMAINKVSSGGEGAQMSFFNSAGPSVTSMQLFDGRSLRVHYASGGHVSMPLVTNRTRANLAAFWEFGANSTTAYDSSGYGNDGTVNGALWTAAGKYGGAFVFDGATTYVSAPTKSNPFADKQGTFAAWLNYSQSSLNNNTHGIINRVWGGGPNNRIYISYSSSQLKFEPTAWNVKSYGCANATLAPNAWHHVAVTSHESGGNLSTSFYVDGEKRCSWSDPVTANLSFSSGSATRTIGNVQFGPPWYYFFNGTIDDVRIYNRVLSEEEISMMYKQGGSAIPLNRQVEIKNVNGTVYIFAS